MVNRLIIKRGFWFAMANRKKQAKDLRETTMKNEINHTVSPNSDQPVGREGFAMVTTLMMVLVLAVLAMGVVWMATSEKKTSFAEQVHISSVFSADAGGEAGINFVRLSPTPPRIVVFADSTVRVQADTDIVGSQSYGYDCKYVRKTPRPGWGVNYLNYNYRIDSTGKAASNGQSGVQLVVTRLYREGY